MEKYFTVNSDNEVDNLKKQLGKEIMLNNHLRKMLLVQEEEIVNLRGELQVKNGYNFDDIYKSGVMGM